MAWLTTVALGALLADRAEASCRVVIDGEAAAALRSSLDAFGDDGGLCLSLRVTIVQGDNGAFVVELHDELGRVARREFATADGAAAFVASWSRRPLPDHANPVAPPRPPPPAPPKRVAAATRPPPVIVYRAPPHIANEDPSPPIRPLSLEVHLDYAFAKAIPYAVSPAIDVVRRDGYLRYGGELRLIGADTGIDQFDAAPGASYFASMVDVELVGTLGVIAQSSRLSARAELLAGTAAVFGVERPSGNDVLQTAGLRAGSRAAVALRLVGALWIQGGAGWDLLVQPGSQHGLGDNHPVTAAHAEIGVMWEP